jgi:MFS family permease
VTSAPQPRLPEPNASGTASGAEPRPEPAAQLGGAYANYLLGVLVLVYVINFLDRQIITILAEDIKADLGVNDAQIGFLYGTAFAVFYAIFGIPLGRLADVWNRRTLIAIGLGFWSLMTALSGFARGFNSLAAARIGVGVGEASASPAAFSMLSDSYPARRRATVLAIYSSGIYLGGGLGLMIGGQVVDRWNAAFPAGTAPLGLAGWQAAYLVVGLPGLLLALWVSTLREPIRGAADGIVSKAEPHPWRAFWRELRAVVPPFTVWHLAREGARRRAIAFNLLLAAGLAAFSWAMVRLTGNLPQWVALPIGIYSALSWVTAVRMRDPICATLLFRTPSLRHVSLGFSLLAFTGYGIAGWTPVFFRRVLEQPAGEVGNYVGITAAVAGVLGITLGGLLADRLRTTRPEGRLYVGIAGALLPIPVAWWMLTTPSVTTAYVLNFPLSVFASMWIGVGVSTVQDLVLPRMRAVASAFYILVVTFIGFALGPYCIGELSDELGDLAAAMRYSLVVNLVSAVILWRALYTLPRDESTLLARARAAGEAGL